MQSIWSLAGGRGGEHTSLLPSRQLSGLFRTPTDRWPSGRWLPGAPRTVTCHGDAAARLLPRSPSPGPSGTRSPGLPLRHRGTERYGHKGRAPKRKASSPHLTRALGSRSGSREKPSFGRPAPARATGHAQCSGPGTPALQVFPATPRGRQKVGPAGGGAGKGRGGAAL